MNANEVPELDTTSQDQATDLSVHASPTSATGRPRKGSYRARAHSNTESIKHESDTRTLHNKVEQMFEDVVNVVHGEMQGILVFGTNYSKLGLMN
jgi:hypothetical protein